MKSCPTCQGSYPNNYAICPADGSPLQESGGWTDGSIVRGKYRLLCKVGQGGMGSVYKALHLAFDELRALKVIAPELLSDELFVKRFKHEAVITRRLQHPNAVRVDDIDEAEDGRPYIVMEFIDGKSLKKIIREEGPLPYPRVLTIVKQTAAALEAAHKLGMVHRDIKPDNIALIDTPGGEMVKVLDFGIAKVKEARMGEAAGMTLTGAGVVIGTPQYMSPEQAMGKKGDELDGRADLYSLGVVMYQMLTADLPFKADTTMEMLLAHMQKAPAPIQTLHPELNVPENVASLTMRLLEKNRDMRPSSARDLIQEIESIENESSPAPTRVMTTTDFRAANQGPAGPTGNWGTGVSTPPPRPPQPPPPIEPRQPAGAPTGMRLPPPTGLQRPPQPPPAESHWGMWVAAVVLLVGIAGGVVYIATQHHETPNPPAAATLTATLTAEPVAVEKGQPVTLRWTSQNATELDLEPGVGKVSGEGSISVTPDGSTTYTLVANGPGGPRDSTAYVSVTAPPSTPVTTTHYEPPAASVPHEHKPKPPKVEHQEPKPPPPPPVDEHAVKGKITYGEFLLKRGEYDGAIAAFQEGLALDPSNAILQNKLRNAIVACKSERQVLGQNYSCGGQ